jgi:hypothetical protein
MDVILACRRFDAVYFYFFLSVYPKFILFCASSYFDGIFDEAELSEGRHKVD